MYSGQQWQVHTPHSRVLPSTLRQRYLYIGLRCGINWTHLGDPDGRVQRIFPAKIQQANVYAYTLEYAMPELFTGMTGYFKNIVPYLDLKPWYQMQELASAYFKVKS